MDTLKSGMHDGRRSQLVKQLAYSAGFDFCGIAKAEPLDEDARRLETWLKKDMQGKMQYMENYFDLRVNPQKLVPGAKSVITLLMNYFPSQRQQEASPRISKYAFGTDYHEVIRAKLNIMLEKIREDIGDIQGRGFVDSAPVLERTWAMRSGLGWVGRNGNLINRQLGSFLFIATLIVDLDLTCDDPFGADFCGTCRRCIDACPTGAILEDRVIDGSKCISYYTIELKEMIPESARGKMENWIFGCDTCQDVCPWNRFSRPTSVKEFAPIPAILNLSTKQWEDMSEQTFKELFRHSPLKRTKYAGIMRNLKFIKE